MSDVYDDNIEYVITSCPCGNTDGSKYSPVGYRDWSRAAGVPMVPVMMRCNACGNLGVKFRTEKINKETA